MSEWLKRINGLLLTVVFALASVDLLYLAWVFWPVVHPDFDLGTALVASGILAAALIVWLPKLQLRHLRFDSTSARFGAENEARKTVAAVIGGLAIFVSFYTAQQQLGLQQQAQFSDRYAKAIDQIAASDGAGNPRLAVRVGGLYVLEQIMNSSEAQHMSILEVLCAYIRDNSQQTALKPATGLRADTRVALTILGRRSRDLEIATERKWGWRMLKAVIFDRQGFLGTLTAHGLEPHLDLSGSNLSGANLSNMVLAGADLSRANLNNCSAAFADLSHINFSGTDLSGCFLASRLEDDNFSGANLEAATITGRVIRPNLKDADITLSIWIGAEPDHPPDLLQAKGWDKAFYNPRDLAALGLPSNHNVLLLRAIRSHVPTAPLEMRMRLSLVLEQLQKLAEQAYDIRQELANPEPQAR